MKCQLSLNVTAVNSNQLTEKQREEFFSKGGEGTTQAINLEDWIKTQLKLGKFKNMVLHVGTSGSITTSICDKVEVATSAVPAVKEDKVDKVTLALRNLGL